MRKLNNMQRDVGGAMRGDSSAMAMDVAMAEPTAGDDASNGSVRMVGMLTHTTAMCWAAAEGDVAMMQRLLREHGADVNAADYDKRTPLHIAVSDSQDHAVAFLLQNGAKTDVVDRWGRSPMDCAVETGNARVMELLERVHVSTAATLMAMGVNPPQIHSNGRRGSPPVSAMPLRRVRSSHDISALFQAVQIGDTEKVKRVWLGGLQLDSIDEQGRTSLHVAVENAQLGVIELLLSADVETNVLDDFGRTPISIALEKRLFAIAEMLRAHQKAKSSLQSENQEVDQRYVSQAFTAAKKGEIDELKRLVPGIVHPDAQDYDLRTLLHIASAEGHLEIARYLVACGANVNLLDRWGTSPLSEAVDFAHNDVARFLVANHATESGNRAAIAVDHIQTNTLTAALEYALRVVTRKRWLMGQVFCPMKDESGICVLVAHSVWHRNDNHLGARRLRADSMGSPPSSPTARSSLSRGATAAASASSIWNDPIQMFRKAGSLMMIDPGQGHTGRVFSGQQPEWLVLANIQQNHLFLLPHARRAGLQTIISVPMVYKMSTIAVLSWYSDELINEDTEELQRIQRLLRSITILATLHEEILSVQASSNAPLHITRYQYCQSLDNAITANGDLLDQRVSKIDVETADTLPLALDWGLFDLPDKLATSMSSEDHTAVVSLLRSLVTLLRNGIFEGVFSETTQEERDESQESIIDRCHGVIRSRWMLLVHLRYYLLYLHAVSPTEGTVFMEVDALVPTINRYFAGESVRADSTPPPQVATKAPPAPTVTAPLSGEKECVLCKFNVPGHIHPGKAPPAPAPPAPKKPVFTASSPYAAGENFFGTRGNPRSPVLREIDAALGKMEAEFDNFDRRTSLNDMAMDGYKSTTFTSSDLYDAIGAAHDVPSTRRQSFGTATEVTDDPRKRLLEVINSIMTDSSCLISFDQLMELHSCLLPANSGQSGVIRTTAAVGYASPRIYRVFLPVGEIHGALRDLVRMINTRETWIQRPLLCAYYAFAIFVFFIHPFHDGNGRCARLLGNIIAKKLGFPGIFRAADKTIQVAEFLHRAIVTMDIITNSRRQTRQTRMLSTRKENSSMWF